MLTIVGLAVAAGAGFVAGLLVGRRNPKIADTAATAANAVKDKVGTAA